MRKETQGMAWIWVLGGALLSLLVIILVLLWLIFSNGISAFWPKPIYNFKGRPMLYWSQKKQSNQIYHLLYSGDHREEFHLISDEELRNLSLAEDAWVIEPNNSTVFFGFINEEQLRDDRFSEFEIQTSQSELISLCKSHLIRAYQSNRLSLREKLILFILRFKDFLFLHPREANLEGGLFPALVGTVVLTLLMMIFLIPVGVLTAIYMHEIAKQSIMVSLVRISVGNLAGVPSIVYGVFGLGFFSYVVGAKIDTWFFSEQLPSPTFGSGGLLWAALTLALLTMPILIVSTEEALGSVELSLREASLGCGATRLQTILRIVLPKAAPGIITGMILALTRGVGEVAPLILTGVVKFIPQLPFDNQFPYLHLERNFTHLAYHIYDLGFHSRSTDFSQPRVFASIAVLIALIVLINGFAVHMRNRLRKRYEGLGAF
jgi:phosphate transport system permease protein